MDITNYQNSQIYDIDVVITALQSTYDYNCYVEITDDDRLLLSPASALSSVLECGVDYAECGIRELHQCGIDASECPDAHQILHAVGWFE